jgi:hypothetical protein
VAPCRAPLTPSGQARSERYYEYANPDSGTNYWAPRWGRLAQRPAHGEVPLAGEGTVPHARLRVRLGPGARRPPLGALRGSALGLARRREAGGAGGHAAALAAQKCF